MDDFDLTLDRLFTRSETIQETVKTKSINELFETETEQNIISDTSIIYYSMDVNNGTFNNYTATTITTPNQDFRVYAPIQTSATSNTSNPYQYYSGYNDIVSNIIINKDKEEIDEYLDDNDILLFEDDKFNIDFDNEERMIINNIQFDEENNDEEIEQSIEDLLDTDEIYLDWNDNFSPYNSDLGNINIFE